MRYSAANKMSRPGFSLVELLVVMGIIAVLFGLAAGATFKVISVQRTSNTETALRTFDKLLQTHWDFVTKDAAKEEPSAAVLTLANNDAVRARVMWIKLRQAEAFPQCYDEVKNAMLGGGVYTLIPKDRAKYMKTYWKAIQTSAGTKPLTESAACLYLALSISRGGNKLDEQNLVSNISDTDGDGVKELIDGFGRSLRFQRFLMKPDLVAGLSPYNRWTPPTGMPVVNIVESLKIAQDELATMNTRGDPIDPDGTLRQQLGAPIFQYWCYSPNGATFEAICGMWFPKQTDLPSFPSQSNPDALAQPYFMPHLISSGRDEIPFTDDDIYSFRLLRVGSTGG